jgi:hypothetical protein
VSDGRRGPATRLRTRLLPGGTCSNAFAEYALQRANEALDVLVHIMNNSGSDAVRMSAAKKIVRRAFGKTAGHFDVTAIKHTDIVYRTVEEIRAEMRRRGLPPALIDKS